MKTTAALTIGLITGLICGLGGGLAISPNPSEAAFVRRYNHGDDETAPQPIWLKIRNVKADEHGDVLADGCIFLRNTDSKTLTVTGSIKGFDGSGSETGNQPFCLSLGPGRTQFIVPMLLERDQWKRSAMWDIQIEKAWEANKRSPE